MIKTNWQLVSVALAVMLVGPSQTLLADFRAHDRGVRGGAPDAGGPIAGLTADEREMFDVGREDFSEEESVADGVGPRFNFVGCAGCHGQPAVGGTSPAVNPLFRVPADLGFAGNVVPWFIQPSGPIREVRFKRKPDGSRDGGVHALFVVSGHPDAAGCTIRQENYERQAATDNIVFRIPTPVFGAGLMEQVSDRALVANLQANAPAKRLLGISGRLNRNGNDGTVTRFGWKAQNASLLLFSGEAYNVEMGITNELFPQERDETASCQFARIPNDVTSSGRLSAIETFTKFQRFLAPPQPSPDTPGGSASIGRGRQLFLQVGCALCHTPSLTTPTHATVAALSGKDVRLYSDLALHAMGGALADDIVQGGARGDEFRTAPLWGLGQRIFFLHDGRTTDLVEAIRAHRSERSPKFGPSEANAVIDRFNRLAERDTQDLLNFLRSL